MAQTQHATDHRRRRLLAVDSVINVVLGGCLLAAPVRTIRFLGLPATDTGFYVSVLGAVLVGIGVALWIERRNQGGLGLSGAIVINVLGAGTVLVWLLVNPFDIPARGYAVLWSVAAIVLATAAVELTVVVRRRLPARRSSRA